MQVEELLKLLRDAGMEDEAIAQLLNEAISSLSANEEQNPVVPEDEEKEKAGSLLGVDF